MFLKITCKVPLEQEFLPVLNGKFTVQARSSVDVHRRAAGNLAEVLSWEEQRVVAKDWTVAWNGRWFQIDGEHERLSLVDRKVVVRQLRSGGRGIAFKKRKKETNLERTAPRAKAGDKRPTRGGTTKLNTGGKSGGGGRGGGGGGGRGGRGRGGGGGFRRWPSPVRPGASPPPPGAGGAK